MTKLKIGLFIGTLYGGGAERAVSRFSKILATKYEVYLILCENTYMEYDYAGTLINMNIKDKTGNKIIKTFNIFKRIKALKKIKKQYQLDMVISFLDSPNLVNAFAKTKKCKTVLSIRGYAFAKINSKIYHWLFKKVYFRADKIVPVSKVMKDKMKNLYSIPEYKFTVLYNPYDLEQINEKKKEPIENNIEDFMKDSFVLVSMGRLSQEKGYWHLIKAFANLCHKYNTMKLLIIGQGEQEEKIKQLIKELHLEEKILQIGFQKNPYKYIARANAYVLSSVVEGFPNALVEAMASNTPVIANDCETGPREIIMDFYNPNIEIKKYECFTNGILTSKLSDIENWQAFELDQEEEDLSQAIELIYKNKEVYNFLKKNSKIAANRFSEDNFLTAFNELIEDLK